ncbi:MAG: hypothetical protein ABII82_06270, partial [Verrucomicrobiota bacterium]
MPIHSSLRRLIGLSVASGLLALALGGCASLPFGQKKSAPQEAAASAPAADLTKLRKQVADAQSQLQRTLGNLARLTNAGLASEVYGAFSRDQAAFARSARKLLVESADVRNNGKAYFGEWAAHAAGIASPEIRTVAEQRRAELEKRYNAMLPPLISARADLDTFMKDNADIEKALAYDQTHAGVAALA